MALAYEQVTEWHTKNPTLSAESKLATDGHRCTRIKPRQELCVCSIRVHLCPSVANKGLSMNRRVFLVTAAAGVAWGQTEVPAPIRKLKPMLDGVQPITDAERSERIEKARRLMHDNKLGAVVFEPGTSLFYFTGRRGGTSSWVLPANGEPAWFEAAPDAARAPAPHRPVLERPRRRRPNRHRRARGHSPPMTPLAADKGRVRQRGSGDRRLPRHQVARRNWR